MTAHVVHDSATARRLRRQLADRLTGADDPWHAAFATVPRHVFAPSFLCQDDQGDWKETGTADPAYLEKVYSDTALTTQLADGAPTSSTSQPSLMISMLRALDVHAGHEVLEVGTGTGYNAALLAHRLGDEHVTTVDVDPALTRWAAERLAGTGCRPSLHTGDGALGVPGRAPFDRVIATCGMQRVPWPWIEQAVHGAVLVVPVGQGLARLTVQGGTAEGRFLASGACFMPRRADAAAPRFEDLDDVTPRRTEVPLADVLDRLSFPLSLALRGHSVCTWNDDRGDRLQAVGIWTPDGSVARATTDGTVREAGEHRLWDCVEQLHRHFPDRRPARDEFTLTVTRDRQEARHSRRGDDLWALPEIAVS